MLWSRGRGFAKDCGDCGCLYRGVKDGREDIGTGRFVFAECCSHVPRVCGVTVAEILRRDFLCPSLAPEVWDAISIQE